MSAYKNLPVRPIQYVLSKPGIASSSLTLSLWLPVWKAVRRSFRCTVTYWYIGCSCCTHVAVQVSSGRHLRYVLVPRRGLTARVPGTDDPIRYLPGSDLPASRFGRCCDSARENHRRPSGVYGRAPLRAEKIRARPLLDEALRFVARVEMYGRTVTFWVISLRLSVFEACEQKPASSRLGLWRVCGQFGLAALTWCRSPGRMPAGKSRVHRRR